MENFIDDLRVRSAANLVAAGLVFYFVQQWLWPAPLGVLVQGVVIGGLTALIAFGLALIYRSNRIINFAQGDLGGVPASLAVLCIAGPGIPYFLAVPLGLVAAIAIGALVEFTIIRRFFKAPRLILTVATIAVSQILALIALVLPRVFDLDQPPNSFDSPFGLRFNIGTVVFQGNEVLAMLVVPVVIAALTGFFRYTNIGIAVRASAESADRAALLGVPVKRIQTIVWIVASTLAYIAVFLRAGIVGLPLGSVLGPSILIRALAAAVIGKMEKLPTIFLASIALGIIENAIVNHTNTPLLVDPILFVIVLAALLLQRRGQAARVDDDETTSWQASREVRPIPRELAGLPEVKWGVRGLSTLFLVLLVVLPFVASDAQTNLAGVVLIFAMIGVSLVVLTGWAGQVSLGQVAFLGIGAAVGGYLTSSRGWDLSLALLGAGIAGAVSAMVIGLPALRIRGLFLAVITLGFALATSSYLLNARYITWLPTGRIDRPLLFGRVTTYTEDRYYFVCLISLGLMVAAVRGLRRSRAGRVIIGVRENAKAAQSYGVNVTIARLTAFAISGFIAAFAGAVFVHHQQQLGTSSFTVDESRRAFTMVVIGGLGSIPGAFLGAMFIQGLDYFRDVFPEVVRPYLGFFTSSVGLLFVLLIIPGGFSQLFYDVRDRILRRIADRHHLIVPSLVADMRAKATAADAPKELQSEDETTVDVGDAMTGAAAGLDELEPTEPTEPDERPTVEATTSPTGGGVATLPRRARTRRPRQEDAG
ncbi:MAG TPA: ABC transporter permease [Acidimicrobiales bacterium]|nr:ABC transporter permease [Acidimicrobiales bacterium]